MSRSQISTAVDKAWQQIEKWFISQLGKVQTLPDKGERVLAPPASLAEVKEVEETLGVEFPVDLRESYLLHNGSCDVWILEKGMLLSLEEIVRDWSLYHEFGNPKSEEFLPGWTYLSDTDKKRVPDEVRKVHWNERWIPVAENGGGDHICVDTDPDERGTIGQVFFRSHEVGPKSLLATSFLELLETYADELQRGVLVFDEWGDFQRTD